MGQKVALVSVSDKRGVAEFGQGLVDAGYMILSTGGTARCLQDAGVPVTPRFLVHWCTRDDERSRENAASAHPRWHPW